VHLLVYLFHFAHGIHVAVLLHTTRIQPFAEITITMRNCMGRIQLFAAIEKMLKSDFPGGMFVASQREIQLRRPACYFFPVRPEVLKNCIWLLMTWACSDMLVLAADASSARAAFCCVRSSMLVIAVLT
jgi:hypothetical protein